MNFIYNCPYLITLCSKLFEIMNEKDFITTNSQIPQTNIIQYDDVSGIGMQGSVYSGSAQGSIYNV